MTSSRIQVFAAAISVFAILLFTGNSRAQENPNRPPWAQPSRKNPPPPVPSPADMPTTLTRQPSDPAQDKISPRTQGPRPGTISVRVNLVSVLVSVVDDHNRPAPDLPKEAFELYEEGVPQKIEIFEPETQQPLDIALMLNASVSMRLEMSTERAAASRFIQQVLRPADRLAVFVMDEDVKQTTSFTSHVEELQDAVRKISTAWGISMNDAVYRGSEALERQGGERRKVIVLLTDAREATSHFDFDAARAAALRAGVLLYTIIIRPVKNENGRNTAGEHALETITDSTGGAMFFPDNAEELDKIFDRIDKELRTQYRLAYYPSPRGPANSYRSIEVKVLKDGYQPRHRKKYLTGPE
jgi:Ca-activated chloride channel family protein